MNSFLFSDERKLTLGCFYFLPRPTQSFPTAPYSGNTLLFQQSPRASGQSLLPYPTRSFPSHIVTSETDATALSNLTYFSGNPI